MAHVDEEIASQPACWREAVRLAAHTELSLPHRGRRVAVVGCGTSWFIAQAYARLRELAGHGRTDAFAASEYPKGRNYDRVVAITRSGTTTEVLDLLTNLPPGTPTTVLVGDPESPAALAATDPVLLPFADERSVVQTRFATSALALLRAHLGEDLAGAISDAEDALTADLPLDPAAIDQVTFLGRTWTVGLAHEAALKCREAAGLWTEAYPALEYRHGPISIAEPGRAVWLLDAAAHSLLAEPDGLVEQVRATGATVVHSDRDPLAELIMVQRFAVAAAKTRDLDPDQPRNLTRSVVLR